MKPKYRRIDPEDLVLEEPKNPEQEPKPKEVYRFIPVTKELKEAAVEFNGALTNPDLESLAPCGVTTIRIKCVTAEDAAKIAGQIRHYVEE